MTFLSHIVNPIRFDPVTGVMGTPILDLQVGEWRVSKLALLSISLEIKEESII